METTDQLSISDLQPGEVIRIENSTELRAFEDALVLEIDPTMKEAQRAVWDTRPNLIDLIRPAKFNGSIRDIRLAVMEHPYERLIEVNKNLKLSSQKTQDLITRYHGYTLIANASSTGYGRVGQIRAEIWYYPIPHKQTASLNGTSVRRVVSGPKMENGQVEAVNKTAREIGTLLLQSNAGRPLTRPWGG